MAPIVSPYTIPADVQVSYPDAAGLLSAAKANVLAEFDTYAGTGEDRESFHEECFSQAIMDEKYPSWVDSLITKHVLGIHKMENRFGFATTTYAHEGFDDGTVYEGKFPYDRDYFLVLAARAAVRSDATKRDIAVGLAGATNIAKLCGVIHPLDLVARYQGYMMTGREPDNALEKTNVYSPIKLRSVMQLAKHILLERARREGWELSPALKDIIADTKTVYMLDTDIIPCPPNGPAYHSDTWMSVAVGEGVDPEEAEESEPNEAPRDESGAEDASPLPDTMVGTLAEILEQLQLRGGEITFFRSPEEIEALMGETMGFVTVTRE